MVKNSVWLFGSAVLIKGDHPKTMKEEEQP